MSSYFDGKHYEPIRHLHTISAHCTDHQAWHHLLGNIATPAVYEWRLPLAMKGITMYGVWSARQIPRIPITWGCINAFIFRHSFRILATSLGLSKPKHRHTEIAIKTSASSLISNYTKAYTYQKHRNISNQARNIIFQQVVTIMDLGMWRACVSCWMSVSVNYIIM